MIGSVAAGAFVGTLLFGAVGYRLPAAPLILYAALVATLAVVVAAGALAGLVSGLINPL
jgi:hypothetical protein